LPKPSLLPKPLLPIPLLPKPVLPKPVLPTGNAADTEERKEERKQMKFIVINIHYIYDI